jgi:predicted ester cyclase
MAVATAEDMVAFTEAYSEAVCIQDPSTMQAMFADDAVSSSGAEPGKPMNFKEHMGYIEERQWAFPDFHFEATNIVANPEKGTTTFEWKVTGTFTNPFKGIKPNGNRITQTGTTELQIVNGKIVRETSFQDRGNFMRQLTAPPENKEAATTTTSNA